MLKGEDCVTKRRTAYLCERSRCPNTEDVERVVIHCVYRYAVARSANHEFSCRLALYLPHREGKWTAWDEGQCARGSNAVGGDLRTGMRCWRSCRDVEIFPQSVCRQVPGERDGERRSASLRSKFRRCRSDTRRLAVHLFRARSSSREKQQTPRGVGDNALRTESNRHERHERRSIRTTAQRRQSASGSNRPAINCACCTKPNPV